MDTAFEKNALGTTERQGYNQTSFTDTKFSRKATNLFNASDNIPNRERGRVIIFIDGSNLFYAALQLKIEIDYVKLLHYLTAKDCLVHVFFYTGYDPTNEKQYGFLQRMRFNGFRVITKAVTQAPNSSKKANLDVEIAVDMMLLAQHCDTAVLVSGDGDFTYVVDAIADRGVRVEVVGLRSMTNDTLIDAADCYTDLAAIQQTIKKIDGNLRHLLATIKE